MESEDDFSECTSEDSNMDYVDLSDFCFSSDVETIEPRQTVSSAAPSRPQKRRSPDSQRTQVASDSSGTRSRARAWCFTLNNPLISGDAFCEFLRTNERIRGFVFQLERGENGTSHFQGYLQFKNQCGFNAVKTLLPTAHIEKAQGTPEQNHAYCTKEDTRISGPWEVGDFLSKGSRSDLAEAAEQLMKGASIKKVMEDHPATSLRYASAIAKFKRNCPPPPMERPLEVYLFIGETGLGKTHSAIRKDFAAGGEIDEDVFIKNPDEWFDGYNGQETAILDDFAGSASKMSLVWLLRLLDKYRFNAPVKGGFEWWTPKKIVVTTNIHPYNWYQINDRLSQYRALTRRFCGVRVFLETGLIDLKSREEIDKFFLEPEAYGYIKSPPPSKN